MLVRFFMTAFQQTGLDNETFFYPLGFSNTGLGRFTNPTSATTDEMLNANFSESFARTAYEIVKAGQALERRAQHQHHHDDDGPDGIHGLSGRRRGG